MLQARTRWAIGAADPALTRELAKQLRVRPLLAALLAARGHSTEEAAFFLSDTMEFHDPFLLDGMEAAADRMQRALAKGERIRIYGDYDADGVSSTALMIRLLRGLGANFDYTIPHRITDGYGLHIHALEQAKRDGVGLMVTVDTGISASEEAEAAKRLGLDLVITDHHEPPERLPDAAAVVNPKKLGCPYPFKGLAGVGVAFKLAHAILGRVPEELAELAAIGTIADLMPLTGENRAIVKLGLERMRATDSTGIAALIRAAGSTCADVTAQTVAFGLAPRINAAGRLESADDGVRLLTTDNAAEAEGLALRLDELNRERQRLVDETAEEAVAQVEASGGPQSGIVVASTRWNPGVIGIVASRLVEKYVRPTVVIAIDPEKHEGKGSARAVPGFHLYDALKGCVHLLDKFGGHESAAGLSLSADKLQQFRVAFDREAAERLTPDMLLPVTKADAEIALSDVTLEAIQELEKLAPYGMGHPVPRFVIRGAPIRECLPMGKEGKHVKLRLANEAAGGEETVDAVGFGFGAAAERLTPGSRADLIGELGVNEWRGSRKPQLIFRDLAVPHRQLFDWREAATAKSFRERWEQMLAAEDRPAFLLDEWEEPPAALSAWWSSVPAYRLGRARGLQPINDAAHSSSVESITDLFLVSCPFPYERFHHILNQEKAFQRLYAVSLGASLGGRPTAANRDDLSLVYRTVREGSGRDRHLTAKELAEKTLLGQGAVQFALQVFTELGFIESADAEGRIRAVLNPRKRELFESPAYRAEEAAARARAEWASCGTKTLIRMALGTTAAFYDNKEKRTTEAIV